MNWKLSLIAIFFLFDSTLSFAARAGLVVVKNAEVYDKPDKASEVLEKLKRKTPIATSNVPIGDFYRVRTPTGTLGWISKTDVDLLPAPSDEAQAPKEVGKDSEQKELNQSEDEQKMKNRNMRNHNRFRIRGLGEFAFIGSPNVVGGLNGFGQGIILGGEGVWMFSSRVGAILRIEQMLKNLALADTGTSKNYLVQLKSLPVTAGIEINLAQKRWFSTHLGILAGLTVPTTFTSTSLNDQSNNQVSVSSVYPTALGKVDFQLYVLRYLSVVFEAGYRYSKSPQFTLVDLTNTGATILQTTFSLDLSGLFMGGGICVNF